MSEWQPIETARGFFRTLAITRYIGKRTKKRKSTICRRKSDDSLWAASSPQNFGYAMGGIFSGKPSWHFAKVRVWQGVPIVSPRTFWAFNKFGLFEITQEQPAYWLEAWPESIECQKIDAMKQVTHEQ